MELGEAGKGVGQFAYMERTMRRQPRAPVTTEGSHSVIKSNDTKKQDKKTYNTAGHFLYSFQTHSAIDFINVKKVTMQTIKNLFSPGFLGEKR